MKKLVCTGVILSTLCGCYPYTEVENMDILTTVYADVHEDAFVLGGGVANVRSFSDTMAENPVSLIAAEGTDLPSAVRALRQSADHELFFGALRAVVIGESLAGSGTDEFIEFLEAQPRLRRSTAVFVTDEDMESIVRYKAINDFSAGFAADSIISTLYEEGEMLYVSVGDILYARTYGDAGYCIPRITVEQDVMRVDGYSLFRGEKMVGFTENPSVVFFSLKNAKQRHLQNGHPMLTRLADKTLDISVKNGALHVDASFSFVLETDNGAATLEQRRWWQKEAKVLRDKLYTQIAEALEICKESGCDYLSLYKSRMAQSRSDFNMQEWNALLKTMTYKVHVDIV